MYIHASIKPLIALIILLWIVIGCNSSSDDPPEPQQTPLLPPPTLSVTPTGQRVDLHALRDGVFVLRQPQLLRESLTAPKQEFLSVGDGIDVDEFGRAELHFADLFAIDILRDGELIVEELSIDDSSGAIRTSERLGTFFNDLPPQEKIKRRFTVESDFALITATGTKFLVVREATTPLEWVIALDAEPGDLEVTAKKTGISKPLTTGQARWVAPLGEPSEVILYDEARLLAWLAAVQNGQPQPEVGDAPAVLWQPADVITNTQFITDQLQPNSHFFVQGVKITLAETLTDTSTTPSIYERRDCNADGIADIMIQNGKLLMDFRGVLARVRALDVTLINYAGSDQSRLSSFNPAYDALEQQSLTVGSNTIQILPLRSQVEPYHYAELALVHGCFLGFSLTPPDENRNLGEPRSEIDTQLPTVTPTVTNSPIPSPTITSSPSQTASPSATVTITPTIQVPIPTELPTITPTEAPTITPTEAPTITPTELPTITPTELPTITPTATEEVPRIPTELPTITPTELPTITPTATDITTEPPTITPTATDITREAATITPTATDITGELPTITPTERATISATDIEPPTITPTATDITRELPTITPTELPTITPTATDITGELPTITLTERATISATDIEPPTITPTERATITPTELIIP